MFEHNHMYTSRAHHLSLAILLAIVIASTPLWAYEPYALTATQLKAADIPQSMVDRLDPHGWLVSTESNGLGMPICEIFWAKAAVLQDGSAKSGKFTYRNLKPGALVGLIHFLPEASEDFREDFHDQKLRPGYYTMRYATIADANSRDFVLLSPIRVDSDGQRVLAASELMRLSRLASRSAQPAVMSLVTTEIREDKSAPYLRTDDQGTCILQVNLHVQLPTGSAEMPVAIIVTNPISNSEGS